MILMMILLSKVLREPSTWVPTLALRLGTARTGPPLSLAKRLGPNDQLAHARSGVPPANPELRNARGIERDKARQRSSGTNRALIDARRR
jgi:hypothetical protein